MKTPLYLILLVLPVLLSGHSYHCTFEHDNVDLRPLTINNPPQVSVNPPGPHYQGKRLLNPSTAGRQAMRIFISNTPFTQPVIPGTNGASATTTARLNHLLNALAVAQNFFENRLKVQQMASITIPNSCVDMSPPSPSSISGQDLVIYATYVTDAAIGYSATGKSCEYVSGIATLDNPDNTLQVGRPTVGRIKFNTYTIIDQAPTVTNVLFQSIVSTTLHQIVHILGFDSTLYSGYLDPALGYPYNTAPQIVNSPDIHASRPATKLLTTPNVKAWARDFFGCSTLAGMPLQNEDGTGFGGGSHWQRVAMYDQLMTGTSFGATKGMSGLTFALLKDTGWYTVDDKFSQSSNYGYKLGCDFVHKACYNGTSFSTFCDSVAQVNISYCSTNFFSKAACQNVDGMMSDGCSMYAPYFNCIDPTSVDSFNYQQFTHQVFSTSSFCVDSTLAIATPPTSLQSRCYPYVCNVGSITFTIGSYSITCLPSQTGVRKTLSALVGYLTCPHFESFCTISRKTCMNMCSQKGYCMGGVCHCLQGYSGSDCSITTCTTATQFYDPSTSSCITGTCPSGYYQNIFSNTCQRCQAPCSQCVNSPTYCVNCASVAGNPQYFYNGNCSAACPSHTYAVAYQCFDCDTATAYCLTCSGSASACTSCSSPRFLSQPGTGSCINTCTGAYPLSDVVNRACVSSCPSNLFAPGNGTCILCAGSTYLHAGVCTSSCPNVTYADPVLKACLNCNSSCLTCVGSYPQNCTSCHPSSGNPYLLLKMCWALCPKGLYPNTATGKCQVCPVALRCNTCKYNGGNIACLSCQYNTFYTSATQTCQNNCASTHYKNTWNNSCDLCDTECLTCNGPSSRSCRSCHPNFYLLSNATGGYCLDACPSIGYVQIGSTSCQPCDYTCSSCNQVDADDCTACIDGYFLYGGYCRYVCPNATYPDSTTKTCLTCDTSCSYCFGGTAQSCTSCSGSLYLYNFTCTSSCPAGMTPNAWNVCGQAWITVFLLVVVLMLTL